MIKDVSQIPVLWWENSAGEKWIQTYGDDREAPPPGFIYQWSRFPNTVVESVLMIVQQEQVDACDHPAQLIRATGGWVTGIAGRECQKCHGTQTRMAGESWPDNWYGGQNIEIMRGSSTWSNDLVAAMVKADVRPHDAVLLAAIACERCMNVMMFEYGVGGYAEDSEEWRLCRTECELCDRWQPMASAPKNATWIELKNSNGGNYRAHYAEDLSGSEQPPFRGWFIRAGSSMIEMPGKPIAWRAVQS